MCQEAEADDLGDIRIRISTWKKMCTDEGITLSSLTKTPGNYVDRGFVIIDSTNEFFIVTEESESWRGKW